MVDDLGSKKDRALAGLKNEFDSLGILQVNLGALKQEIKDFYEELLHKLEIKITDESILQSLLNSFDAFKQSLIAFKANEMEHPGTSDEIKLQIKEALKSINISLVTLLMGYPAYLETTTQIASAYFSSGKLTLDECIYKSKAAFNVQILIGQGFADRTNWRNFWAIFSQDLEYASIPVSFILEREIKYHVNEGKDEVLNSRVEEFYKYIWVSRQRFNSFKNRATLLMNLQNNLKIDYQLLQLQEISNLKLTLGVSVTPQPNYPKFPYGMNYIIGPSGLEGSERYCGDRLVLFGKESDENYINDITLPNASNLRSLQMAIYCSPRGFALQDFSEQGLYIKLKKNEPKEVKKGWIIRLGFIREIVIKDIEYFSNKEGCNIAIIIHGDTISHDLKIYSKDLPTFFLGRDSRILPPQFLVEEKSVSGKHLEFNFINNKWLMTDLSTNGACIRVGKYNEGLGQQEGNYTLDQVPKELIIPWHHWIQDWDVIFFGKAIPFFEYKLLCRLERII